MGLDEAKNAIVKVGGGRGFVVQGERDRLVITAGHCLPDFPTCHSSSHTEERTYKALLGSLGEKPAVWAECLFADPIGDVAVLGPHHQLRCGRERKLSECEAGGQFEGVGRRGAAQSPKTSNNTGLQSANRNLEQLAWTIANADPCNYFPP
jgi:hypothetical protein